MKFVDFSFILSIKYIKEAWTGGQQITHLV